MRTDCKNLNIKFCPNCKYKYETGYFSKDIFCWIEMFKQRVDEGQDIKALFIRASKNYSSFIDKPLTRSSFWLYEMVKIHFPQDIPTLDKMMVLL